MTVLQEQIETKRREIEELIVTAIKSGANVQRNNLYATVDGVWLHDGIDGHQYIYMPLVDEVICNACSVGVEVLQAEADILRGKLADIEKQIAERRSA